MFAVDLNYPPVRYVQPKVAAAYNGPITEWADGLIVGRVRAACVSFDRIQYACGLYWREKGTTAIFSINLDGKVYKGSHRTKIYTRSLSGYVRINSSRYAKFHVPDYG